MKKNIVETEFHDFILMNGKSVTDPNKRKRILSGKKTAVNWICDSFEITKKRFYSSSNTDLVRIYGVFLQRETEFVNTKFLAMKYCFRWYFKYKGIPVDPIRGFGTPNYGYVDKPSHRINHVRPAKKYIPKQFKSEEAQSLTNQLIPLANLELFTDAIGEVYIKLSSSQMSMRNTLKTKES